MTNDMERICSDQGRSLYCMFLNTQGRVLFDSLIYAGREKDEYFLDVDSKVSAVAKKHLGFYKIRKKVGVEICSNLSVFVAYKEDAEVIPPSPSMTTQSPLLGSTFCSGDNDNPGTSLLETDILSSNNIQHCFIYPDPRLTALGSRLILDTDQCQHITPHIPEEAKIVDQDDYIHLRCELGVTEGVDELGFGKVTPLEFNLDYLYGVNFHKGCYIGQELTARTHHTGVIRKRILPIAFNEHVVKKESLEGDLNIVNEMGKSVGKVKKIHGNVGLGLMRLKETFAAEKLTLSDSEVEINSEISVSKPEWWPSDKDDTKKTSEA